jgi:pimeloyl-ACP methyl ester carboxylesterase/putative sterol carrier protein
VTSAAPAQGADLDTVLAGRLRRSLTGTSLATRRATVVLDAGESGVWTLDVEDGRSRARRGGAEAPTLHVRASAAVLAQVVDGTLSGVRAFLAGQVHVRGELALALQLDSLFGGCADPQAPRWRETTALGVRTSWIEAGPADAPPVVLLHGLGATNASMLPVLADLAVDHRVLAPDSPGFGASDAPASPYTSAWYAAWLEDFQARTGSRGAVLVGNSLGGRIAIEAGLQHPRSVRALVLLAPSPAFRSIRAFVPMVRAVPAGLARLPMPAPSHQMVVEAIRTMMSVPGRMPQDWYDAAADEAVRVLRSPAHRVAFLSCARQIYLEEAYGRHGFWARLPGLMPPALFVWGDRDRLVPASFARHVSDALPEAGSVVMEDCGHVPQFEHPAELMGLVRGFLSGL